MAATLAQVNPVVRPLLATVKLRDGFSPLPPVDEMPGGAAANVPLLCCAPSSRIAPVVLTAPESTCAIAASALVELDFNGSQPVSVATSSVPAPSPNGVQLLSIRPGWMMMSPTVA